MKRKKYSGCIPDHARLKALNPEDWRKAIRRLPLEIRAEVARVVWWDWFSDRQHGERWPHLDEYLEPPFHFQPEMGRIVDGLVMVGYSWDRAVNRMKSSAKYYERN